MIRTVDVAAEQEPGGPATDTAIAILALNPSLDISYEVAQLIPDQKTHATRAQYDPGGTGINVARTLKTLGVRAETYCLVGGAIGRLVEEIAVRSIDALHCVHIPGETRINCADALRQAVACGSGTAEKHGTGLCTPQDVLRISNRVVVRELAAVSPGGSRRQEDAWTVDATHAS
jgi:fructose-1-phosphate kinase PfkB-like protein